MSVFNNIQNALNTQLNSIGGLPTIYWPNIDKTPANGTNYLRPTLLPANSENYTLNGPNYHQGIYQVDVFASIKKGTSEALLIADAIRTGFLRQSLVSGGTIVHIQSISMSTAQRDESWWRVSVEINYLSVE